MAKQLHNNKKDKKRGTGHHAICEVRRTRRFLGRSERNGAIHSMICDVIPHATGDMVVTRRWSKAKCTYAGEFWWNFIWGHNATPISIVGCHVSRLIVRRTRRDSPAYSPILSLSGGPPTVVDGRQMVPGRWSSTPDTPPCVGWHPSFILMSSHHIVYIQPLFRLRKPFYIII